MKRKHTLLLATLLFSFTNAWSQPGCTDPQATNYNPAATSNDGSCIYPVTHSAPVLRAQLPTIITESSGLVWTDGKLWTHNDSGNPAEIYNIDTTTGLILQTVYIDNYPNTDWEDITADSTYIYIENCGNNNGDRTDLNILKISKASIGSGTSVHVLAQAINLSYTDQTSFTPSSTNNFDCESIISIKDSLYLFTKDRGDLKTRVYKLPKVPGTYAVSPYTSLDAGGLVTGADYDPVTNEVVLIGYLSDHTHSFLWYLNDYQDDMFFSGNKRRIEIGGTGKWQTEGVAFQSDNRLFISCETNGGINASLYTDSKAWDSSTAVVNTNYNNNYSIYPNPATDILSINNPGPKTNYRILDISGKTLQQGLLPAGHDTISIKQLVPGNYTIAIRKLNGKYMTMKVVKR